MSTEKELIQELYLERNLLSVLLANFLINLNCACIKKSRKDHEGKEDPDYFILTFVKVGMIEQFSFHVPIRFWKDLEDVPEGDGAYFDGHTKADAIKRLELFVTHSTHFGRYATSKENLQRYE
jgi:hypothetical protein